jgi:hypothetical protein
VSPSSKCHSLMFILNCKFRQHCHFVWIQIQITFRYLLHRSICAAAFLLDLLGLLCSATLTASIFSGERNDEGRRRLLSNTEPQLLNLL